MALNSDAIEEESFIILGTSPGTSLDIKCNGLVSDGPLDKAQIEDAMKDLSVEAGMAFKAHFKLGDCPSPASLMVASNIISEDKSTEELQKRFGEILDENVLLKETLKQNNDSMKDQFLLIASCQEDMMKTHSLHKEKFEETRELVERLRQENKKLKQDLLRVSEGGVNGVNVETGEAASGPPSAVEFVTSPDDDTVNKLTAQLELVEKQRRQVILDNEKLTWQKESLEHIVDAISKERDLLKEKLKNVELQLSSKDSDYAVEINKLKTTIQGLQSKLQSSSSITSLSTEEIRKRDALIQQLEGKLSALQSDFKTSQLKVLELESVKTSLSVEDIRKRDALVQQLEGKLSALQSDHKTSQLKVLELESIKLEFTKHKSGTAEIVRIYKDRIRDLHNRLKDAQVTLFQPVRLSLTPDTETQSSEFSSYLANVKLYDRTLKHLGELLNNVAHNTSDNLVHILGVVASLHDYKLERGTAEQVKTGLFDVKKQLEAQYNASLNNIGQVRSTMTILEGIFKDYNELLKKALTLQSKPAQGANVEALTAALLARGQEVSALTLELRQLRGQQEEVEVLKAQLDLYKSDFEAERDAREKMAAEKENILTDLRTTQRRNQELIQHIQQSPARPGSAAQSPASAGALQPTIGSRQPTTGSRQPTTGSRQPTASPRQPTARPAAASPSPTQGNTTGNTVYKCPKCMRFSSEQYKAMEDRFDFCLDDF